MKINRSVSPICSSRRSRSRLCASLRRSRRLRCFGRGNASSKRQSGTFPIAARWSIDLLSAQNQQKRIDELQRPSDGCPAKTGRFVLFSFDTFTGYGFGAAVRHLAMALDYALARGRILVVKEHDRFAYADEHQRHTTEERVRRQYQTKSSKLAVCRFCFVELLLFF